MITKSLSASTFERSHLVRYRARAAKLGCAAAILLATVSPARAQSDDPDIRVTPTSVAFGKVNGTKTKRITIQNKGKADLSIDSIERCAQTSPEFDFMSLTATVAPKKKVTLEVSYSPADDGADAGCLEVFSNDPDEPKVTIALSGSARTATPASSLIRLRPSSLDFGEVGLGSTSTIHFRVQSQGQTLPQVAVNRCFETSAEFSFAPTTPFQVAPGNSPRVSVTYSPTELGDADGCLEVRSGNPDDAPAVLGVHGTGVDTVDGVDLDIHDFRVRNRTRVDLGQKVKIQLWVKNPGSVDEPRMAHVVGEQNGESVYDEELMVEDRVGNQGVTKFSLPSFKPSEVGDILWTATIDDDDPDEDRRLAVTHATEKGTPSTGVDLDIRRFNVTRDATLGQGVVRIRLKVLNNGTEDEARPAAVVGMQEGVEIYSQTLSVADSVGNQGSTVHKFPNYQPTAVGDILWMVVIADDDPDLDEALSVTHVSER